MKPNIVFPGSFNPMHPGHLLIIMQAKELGYTVEVLVASNPDKTYSSHILERFQKSSSYLIDKGMHSIKISMLSEGDTVPEWCRRNEIENVLRGVRDQKDLVYELKLKQDYLSLNDKLKFVYIDTGDNTSSSLIREREMEQ